MKRIMVVATGIVLGLVSSLGFGVGAAQAAAPPVKPGVYTVEVTGEVNETVWRLDSSLKRIDELVASSFVYGTCTEFVDPRCIQVEMYEAGKNNNGQHQWKKRNGVVSHWIRLNAQAEREWPHQLKTTLVHELGHLAGLPHSSGCVSVMHPQSGCGKGKARPETFTEDELKVLARF